MMCELCACTGDGVERNTKGERSEQLADADGMIADEDAAQVGGWGRVIYPFPPSSSHVNPEAYQLFRGNKNQRS